MKKTITISQEQTLIKTTINKLQLSIFDEIDRKKWIKIFGDGEKSKLLKHYYDNDKNIKYIIYILVVYMTYPDEFDKFLNTIFMVLTNMKRYIENEDSCMKKPKMVEEKGEEIGNVFLNKYRNVLQMCYMYMDYKHDILTIIEKIKEIFMTVLVKLRLLKDNISFLTEEERVNALSENLELDEPNVKNTIQIKDYNKDEIIKYLKSLQEGYELSNVINKVWNNKLPQEYSLNISTKIKDVISRMIEVLRTG